MVDLAARILATVTRPSYSPIKAKALAKRMGVTDDSYPDFRRTLRQLIREGRLALGRNQTIRPADPHGTVVGIFRRLGSGHGYVRPHPTDEGIHDPEIFIRDDHALDAATGDEVLVRLTRPASGSKDAAGQILRVLERATRTFVGTYFERDGLGYVRVDGTVFSHSVLVGDPGAKGAKPQDKVVIEMLRFPSPDSRGEGVITQVLGRPSDPGVDTLSIIKAFGLPEEFSEAALAEARAVADAFREDDRQGRTDFTQDLVITIDPPDARDFDDAVSVDIDTKSRHWMLSVHVADVSHFVKPGGPLDLEARKRATSVYLPDRVIPMFPEILSNGLASLQEGKIRFVKTARMEFTPNLQKGTVTFANGVIRVRKRFTYDQVTEILNRLADPDKASHLDPVAEEFGLDVEVLKALLRMRDLAMRLRKKRLRRGALELTIPEAVLEYDRHGRVTGAHFARHDVSHQIIEEFMLAANEAVAEHLTQLGIPFLRRVHPAPNEDKLHAFALFAEVLGYPIRRVVDRFELQRILTASADKPERAALHYAFLRSLKQAVYSPIQDQHYALALEHYCHFTSPIRRYPDLTVHRLLDRWLKHRHASADVAELVALGDHCSRMERRAETAERELVKLKLLLYLSDKLGLRFDAVITGVADYGFYAQSLTLPVEGLVHISSLTDDYYEFDESHYTLYGRRQRSRYRLGDAVRVEVARVDVQKRLLDLRVVRDDQVSPVPAEELPISRVNGRSRNEDSRHPRRKRRR